MRIFIVNYHPHTHLGGAEVQADLLARHWTRAGHDVVYGALDTRSDDFATWEPAYPVLALPNRSWGVLGSALEELRPDIVYWRAGRFGLAAAAGLSKLYGARFVFAIVSANHVKPWWYAQVRHDGGMVAAAKYGLLRARDLAQSRLNFEAFRWMDGIVSNTRRMLEQAPQGPAYTEIRAAIYNAMEPTVGGEFTWPRPYVLWVANLTRIKRPEAYVEAARRLQDVEVDFLMIGKINQAHYEWVRDRSQVPANFHYLGPRTLAEVDTALAGSELLVHTCEPEGFPGNFVQAWWQGVPTITLSYDPDDVITRHAVGRRSGSLDRMVADIRELLGDEPQRRAMGARALELARAEFDPATNAQRYLEFFERVLRR